MRILVFGRVGQLGSALAELLPSHHVVTFLDQPDVDLAKLETLPDLIRQIEPELVINAAAYTAGDKAESEPQLAGLINAHAPREMAKTCQTLGIPLIHYSTDYVFDGSKNQPYNEDDIVNPLGVYGKSKRAGEKSIIEQQTNSIIIRTSWLYSNLSNNFVEKIIFLNFLTTN